MKPFQSLPGRANYLNSLVWNNPDHLITKFYKKEKIYAHHKTHVTGRQDSKRGRVPALRPTKGRTERGAAGPDGLPSVRADSIQGWKIFVGITFSKIHLDRYLLWGP